MKCTIAVKWKYSGETTKEHFPTKAKAYDRWDELRNLGRDGRVVCFWFWEDCRPERRCRISFDEDGTEWFKA